MILKINGIDLLFYTDIQKNKLILEENSEILAVNAKEKARQAAEQTGYICLGDDSGVYITALDYFPGAHSRRWTASEFDDTERNRQIIELMKNEEDRSAYLTSRFSLVDPDGNELFKTVVKNKFYIAENIYGDSGFGYDPILIPDNDSLFTPAYNEGRLGIGKETFDNIFYKFYEERDITIGCLNQEAKNAINNRGRIAKELKDVMYDE